MGNYAKSKNLFHIFFNSHPQFVSKDKNLIIHIVKGNTIADAVSVYRDILFDIKKESDVLPERQIFKHVSDMTNKLLTSNFTELVNKV